MAILLKLPYIAESFGTGKKKKFLVMFPDGTGNAYILDRVDPKMQFPASRAKLLPKKPSLIFYVNADGVLMPNNVSAEPGIFDAAAKLVEGKYSLNYLVQYRYLLPHHALGMMVGGLVQDGKTLVQANAGAIDELQKHIAANRKAVSEWMSGTGRSPVATLDLPGELSPSQAVVPVESQVVLDDKRSTEEIDATIVAATADNLAKSEAKAASERSARAKANLESAKAKAEAANATLAANLDDKKLQAQARQAQQKLTKARLELREAEALDEYDQTHKDG